MGTNVTQWAFKIVFYANRSAKQVCTAKTPSLRLQLFGRVSLSDDLLALIGNLSEFRNSPERIRQLSENPFQRQKTKLLILTDGSVCNPSPTKPKSMTHYFTVA